MLQNTPQTEEQINFAYNDFTNTLISFGSLDIRTAVKTALEVGENGSYAAECVNDFADNCDIKISDCDPCYCIYDAILQTVRTEIEELTKFDFLNDGAEIYTAGNFCATSYDYTNDAPSIIVKKLKKSKIKFAILSVKAQWFLSELNANY